MIKRLGILLALMAIVVGACSSGGSGGATAAPATAASSGAASAAAPSEAAPSTAASAGASAAKLVIWADDKRAAAIKPLAQQWATDNGVTVEVQAITENLTTQFKTASQQGTGPDIVVWAHDAVADFVQNSAIDPVTMPDTSMFDPLAVKGMTYQGQLYGVPYSIENIALIRNTDLAPDCPATMEDLVSTGQALVKDKKVTNIMALQVGQKGDAYHIYPLFTSGGGSFFGTTATGDPDGTNVTVDSAGIHRGRPEALRPGREGRRRAQALRRRQERHPAVHRRQDPLPRLRPVGHRGHREGQGQLRRLRDPRVRGRQAGVAVHRRQRLLPRQQGQEQDARPGVPHERRPDPRVPVGPVRGRPAPPGADRVRHGGGGRRTPTSRSSRTPEPTARSCPRSRRWARSGARSASPRPPSSAAPTPRRPSRPPPRRSAKGSPTSSRRSARCGRAIREGRSGRVRRTAGRRGSRCLPAPCGVTEEERSGDCDIHHAALRPGRRQHAGAAREDPAARDRRRDRRRGRDPARRQPGVVLAHGAGPGHPGDLRRLPAAVAHPAQVHHPGHDLPGRLPGRPGRVHLRGVVHELR